MFSKILFISLIASLIENALSCNGYKVKIVNYENCGGPDQVVIIEDGFQVKLNKNCELVPQGCVKYKAFQSAIGSFQVFKDGMKMKDGVLNPCDAVKKANAEQRNLMKLFTLPDHCPVEEGRICATGQAINVSKYKNMLAFARGSFITNATIQHDNNRISCFGINLDISK